MMMKRIPTTAMPYCHCSSIVGPPLSLGHEFGEQLGCGGVGDALGFVERDIVGVGQPDNFVELGLGGEGLMIIRADLDLDATQACVALMEAAVQDRAIPRAMTDAEAAGVGDELLGERVLFCFVGQHAERDAGPALFHGDRRGPCVERALGQEPIDRGADLFAGHIVEVHSQLHHTRRRIIMHLPSHRMILPTSGPTQSRRYNHAVPKPPAHYHPLVRSIAKALRQRCMVTPGSAIVVACSGGADSVALLHALALLAGRRKWQLRLIVGHVQHHLRDEAEGDAAFVAQLTDEMGLPFARRDIRPGDRPGNVEANARELRYQALADIAREHAATFIATAHHADDQLETLLMRFLRGSSVAGLRGIAWHKPLSNDCANGSDTSLCVIRPMLGVERQSALALLDQLGKTYRDDATNRDTTRTRSKLRHDVIPRLKSIQPDSAAKANAMADHFREVHTLIQDAANAATKAGETKGSGVVLYRARARAMNPLVLTELLRRALLDAGCGADRLTRQALRSAVVAAQDPVGSDRVLGFANGIALRITRDTIYLVSSGK